MCRTACNLAFTRLTIALLLFFLSRRYRGMDHDRRGILMKKLFCGLALLALGWALPVAAAPSFTMDTKFLTPPDGMATIGDSHGDIAVDAHGRNLCQRPGRQPSRHPGLQRARDNTCAMCPAHRPTCTASSSPARRIGNITSMASAGWRSRSSRSTLDGRDVLTIPASAIPDQYKKRRGARPSTSPASRWRRMATSMSPTAMAWTTSITSTRRGKYLATFGGKAEPYGFRYLPQARHRYPLHAAQAALHRPQHNRLVHMDLDGHVIGVFADGLRLPSALVHPWR